MAWKKHWYHFTKKWYQFFFPQRNTNFEFLFLPHNILFQIPLPPPPTANGKAKCWIFLSPLNRVPWLEKGWEIWLMWSFCPSVRPQWFRSAVIKENAMPDGLMTLLFSNIDPIYEFHRGFLKELDQRLALWWVRDTKLILRACLKASSDSPTLPTTETFWKSDAGRLR